MPSARCRGPKGAGSRKEPGAGRCQSSPEEPENRAREKSKEPEKPGRSPRSPEGAERKRGARRTTGPSSVLSPCFAGCPPVIGRSLADRWPVVGRLLCRLYLPITACFNWFSSCSPVVGWSLTRSFAGRLSVACRDFPGCQLLRRLFAGSSPVLSVGAAVPRAVLRPLADFVCRACSVGSVGSIGPLVRRVHWRRRGSVGTRTLPPPGLAPDEKCTRPEPPARMPTTVPLRTQNPLAQTFSARNIPAQAAPSQAAFTLAAHFGRTSADRYAQNAPLRTHSFGPPRSGCPVQAVPAQAGNSSGWLLT